MGSSFRSRDQSTNMAWKNSSPPPNKFRVATSRGKVMPSIFWDIEGVVLAGGTSKLHLGGGDTIIGNNYAQLIRKLCRAKTRVAGCFDGMCCFIKRTRPLTSVQLQWLPAEVRDLYYSIIYNIRRISPPVISICPTTEETFMETIISEWLWIEVCCECLAGEA